MHTLSVFVAGAEATLEVPAGRVVTVWGGFELDSDLLSGGKAKLVTDPALIAKHDKTCFVAAPPVPQKPEPVRGR